MIVLIIKFHYALTSTYTHDEGQLSTPYFYNKVIESQSLHGTVDSLCSWEDLKSLVETRVHLSHPPQSFPIWAMSLVFKTSRFYWNPKSALPLAQIGYHNSAFHIISNNYRIGECVALLQKFLALNLSGKQIFVPTNSYRVR